MFFFALLALAFQPAPAESAASKPLVVELKDGAGKKLGTASLHEEKKGVRIVLQAEGISPGEHAFHIHEKGECVGPGFQSAGPHFSASGEEHGHEHAKKHHAGDMKNIVAAANGKVDVVVLNERVSLTKQSLRRPGGTALVIHAKADDYKSQPSGNAGDRIACGVIPAL